MLEKSKSAVDKGKSFGALVTDQSKAFDSRTSAPLNVLPMDLALRH